MEQLFYSSGGCFQKLLDIEEALSWIKNKLTVSLFFIHERASSISSTTLSETCFSLFLSSIYL